MAIINSEYEVVFLVVLFAFVGVVLIGALLTKVHLDRWHPKLIAAAIGALIGVALVELIPMLE